MIRLNPTFLFAVDPQTTTSASSSRLYTMLPTAVQKRLPRFSPFRPRSTAYDLIDATPQLDRNGRVQDFNPGFVRNGSVSSSSRSPSPPNSHSSPNSLGNPDWKYINQGSPARLLRNPHASLTPSARSNSALDRDIRSSQLSAITQHPSSFPSALHPRPNLPPPSTPL